MRAMSHETNRRRSADKREYAEPEGAAKHGDALLAGYRVLAQRASSRFVAQVTSAALAFSEARDILSLKRRQSEIRTYISWAPPNNALLRLSGQHGAARGAIR
jgi:hypothetical protein